VPARECAQPRHQLLGRERLDQVVVCAGLQSRHAVGDGVACGQHENRDAVAGGADAAADLEPVDLGHEQIEHDRVRRALGELVERLLAVRRQLDLVAVHAKRTVQCVAYRRLVVDYKDAHGADGRHPT
jgi:hypothetical protein